MRWRDTAHLSPLPPSHLPHRPAHLSAPDIEAWILERELVVVHLSELAAMAEDCAGDGELARAALCRWAGTALDLIATNRHADWLRAALRGWHGQQSLIATATGDHIHFPALVDIAWRLGCPARVVHALTVIHNRSRRPDSSNRGHYRTEEAHI